MLDTRWAKHLEDNFSELLDKHFIVACSGGVDSVVLSHLCAGQHLNFSLAHVNFQLRGRESDLDADFVRDLAKKLGVDFYLHACHTDSYAAEHKVSIQVAAREIRYEWFKELARETGAFAVLTAHHLDDSLENFALQAARGSGLKGLLGVPQKRDIFWRPLLPFNKSELLDWAAKKQYTWREDKSNALSDYTRNKVRNDLFPIWFSLFPEAKNNLSRTQENLNADYLLLEAYLDMAKAQCLQNNTLDLDAIHRFASAASTNRQNELAIALAHALLRPYGFDTTSVSSEWLFRGRSGTRVYTPTSILHKNRHTILIESIEQSAHTTETYYLDNLEGHLSHPIKIQWSITDHQSSMAFNRVYFDAETLEFPLVLRKRIPGDVLYPTEMKGSKKLSKFFKDQKFSTPMKDAQWLLCNADQSIVWVVGVRQDRRWSVQQTTKKILCVHYDN